MNPIYTDLTEPDLKIEHNPAVIHTHVLKPKLTGIKVSLLTAFFLLTVALLGMAYLYYSVQYEGAQRRTLERSHVTLSERTSSLETLMDESKQEIRRLNQRMTKTVDQEIRGEIERRRIEIVNLQKKLRLVEDRSLAIEQQLKLFQTPPSASENVESSKPSGGILNQTEGDPAPITAQPSTPAAKPASESQVASGKNTQTSASAPAKKARVLTINQKFQFVVINIGIEHRVQEGHQFVVLRDAKEIGLIQVEKLYDSFSAATILEENPDVPLQVGDSIRQVS